MPENVSVVVKNPIALSCEASGIPLPAISWLKDGQPVKVSGSVRVLSGESLSGIFRTINTTNVFVFENMYESMKSSFILVGSFSDSL